MSYIINQIQNCLEKAVGQSIAEISLNSLIGCAAGYLLMKYAKSFALITGACLLGIEAIIENSSVIVEHGSSFQKYFKMFLELLTLDEIYRRCAARGFFGGLLIGMSIE